MYSHWEFEPRRHVTGFYNLREPDYFYTHESDPDSEFWYPIPIIRERLAEPGSHRSGSGAIQPKLEEADGSSMTTPAATPFISCSTSRTFMKLGERLYPYSPNDTKISVRDFSSGRWAGVLIPQNLDDINVTSNTSEQTSVSSRAEHICELVAISTGWAYHDWPEYSMDEWGLPERPRTEDRYEWYNVLWIEWYGGVARRKAVGRICKEVWEVQKLEAIRLVLN